MKECRWLTTELVGQFEFVEWTRDNHLRHSRLIAPREDKKPSDMQREPRPGHVWTVPQPEMNECPCCRQTQTRTTSSFGSGGDATLQLVEPIEDYVELDGREGLPRLLNH